MTLANFICVGTMPELKDKLKICVKGVAIFIIDSFSNLVDTLSWPILVLALRSLHVFINSNGTTGSKKKLILTRLSLER